MPVCKDPGNVERHTMRLEISLRVTKRGGAMASENNEIMLDDMPRKRLLKAAEVAAYLGVSAKTVYRWCDMGLMESVKLNRSVRVLRTSVVDFLSCGKNVGLG